MSEIETVLQRLPGVAEAVVSPHQPAPGVNELVAYYSVRPGTETPDPACLYEGLRRALPAYMVPAYLELLDEVPLMPSGKVDRRALPAPRGPRHLAAGSDYVAPSCELESVLASELSDLMGLERVSVESHLFDELGADSLLIARFSARVRHLLELPPVSIRDIYLNPTVRSLAAAISEPGAAGDRQPCRSGLSRICRCRSGRPGTCSAARCNC